MNRMTKPVITALAALALAASATPLSQAQPLPGGSVTLPPVAPIPVAVPTGSAAAQLPGLPFPLFWQDTAPPSPPAPRFVASNWVVAHSGCPAANQWAYAEDGTKLWCTRLALTDARVWAPHTTPVPYSPDFKIRPTTAVGNSLAAKPCRNVGDTAVDPSNGQTAHCDWRRIDSDVPVWQYQPGS